jgi:hypothetical protein
LAAQDFMMVISFDGISFLMIKYLAVTSMLIMTMFALGPAVINNFVMGQTNTTNATGGSDGNSAKMHVDEALKSLQSNDTNGANMHLNEASKASPDSAKMHVDEALKSLQSNDTNGANMHAQEAQKNL